MAYAVTHFFPGGAKEQYEASIATVHPSRTTLPKGQTFHAAGPAPGGWMIFALFDSKASYEHFRDGSLNSANAKRHQRRTRRAASGNSF